MQTDIVITHAYRTAIGSFQGVLASKTAPELGGHAIAAVLENVAQMNSDIAQQIDEVIMGCVLPAGLGQAPARQAGFHGGLADSIPATTINKMCGSGMKAVMLGVDQLRGGDTDFIIAVKNYISVSDEITQIQEIAKEKRKKMKKLSDYILAYMQDNETQNNSW